MTTVREVGFAALKSREGVRLTAYRDSVGVPAIGWGHTLARGFDARLRALEAGGP